MKRFEMTLIVFFVFLMAFSVGYLFGIKIIDYQNANRGVHTTVKIEV